MTGSSLSNICYQVDFSVSKEGKHVSYTKRRISWKFGFASIDALVGGKEGHGCRGEEHEVVLVWSTNSGKRSVLLNGEEVHYSIARSHTNPTFETYVTLLRGSPPNAMVSTPEQTPPPRHSLRIKARKSKPRGAGPTFRQYDLYVDGQSFFNDMPKMYQLGRTSKGGRDYKQETASSATLPLPFAPVRSESTATASSSSSSVRQARGIDEDTQCSAPAELLAEVSPQQLQREEQARSAAVAPAPMRTSRRALLISAKRGTSMPDLVTELSATERFTFHHPASQVAPPAASSPSPPRARLDRSVPTPHVEPARQSLPRPTRRPRLTQAHRAVQSERRIPVTPDQIMEQYDDDDEEMAEARAVRQYHAFVRSSMRTLAEDPLAPFGALSLEGYA